MRAWPAPRRPEARFRLILEDEIDFVCAADAHARALEYRPSHGRRAWTLIRHHWFSALVAVGAIAAATELIVRRNASDAQTTSLWITLPLVVIMIVPLFWWRRFPFGAPATVFVIGALESFVDGRLAQFTGATFFAVLAAVFLFGVLEDRIQAVAGLGIVFAYESGLVQPSATRSRAIRLS